MRTVTPLSLSLFFGVVSVLSPCRLSSVFLPAFRVLSAHRFASISLLPLASPLRSLRRHSLFPRRIRYSRFFFDRSIAQSDSPLCSEHARVRAIDAFLSRLRRANADPISRVELEKKAKREPTSGTTDTTRRDSILVLVGEDAAEPSFGRETISTAR